MVEISVGTFNLNNLFSRFNFAAEVEALPDGSTALEGTVSYTVAGDRVTRFRTFEGRLVRAKSPETQRAIADRIARIDADVLAVQEVEDIDTLRRFAREDLGGRYPFQVLVEGNDPRLIDVGILSKLPIGGVTSWRYAVHPHEPSRPVFSRDLLEVEILNRARTRRLFTLFNTHLKSQFVPADEDPALGAERANAQRRRQAEVAARIVGTRMRPGSRFLLVGDMNDPPHSPFLAPLVAAPRLGLVDALTHPTETRPARPDVPPPASSAWTHRFKEPGRPAAYELLDQIWLSRALAPRQTGAFIDRRTTHAGDGSDHDPAWVTLDL